MPKVAEVQLLYFVAYKMSYFSHLPKNRIHFK